MQGALLAAPPAATCRTAHTTRTHRYRPCSLILCSEQGQLQMTRRATLASTLLLAARPAWAEPATAKRSAQDGVDNSQSVLVQRLLESSARNKEAYNKERLDSYYRRNLRDFFANPASVRGLSEDTKRRISEWLEKNPA